MDLDLHYTDPRLVALYDLENASRHDVDFYLDLIAELEAVDVADLGCGTGVFAADLASRGHRVTGVDPATAMLDVARARPGGDTVTWVHGTSADLGEDAFDLLVMTGNVAQVFLDDDGWREVLGDIHRALRPGGWLAFEARDPAAAVWHRWNPEQTRREFAPDDGEPFTTWVEVDAVQPGLVDFRGVTEFPNTGERVHVPSRLRFRTGEELLADLAATGFEVVARYGDWRGGPVSDASTELIHLAQRAGP